MMSEVDERAAIVGGNVVSNPTTATMKEFRDTLRPLNDDLLLLDVVLGWRHDFKVSKFVMLFSLKSILERFRSV
jgi:hypothetical protein